MKKSIYPLFIYIVLICFLCATGYAPAEIPDWWITHQVVDLDHVSAENYAPANQGQAKNLAKKAYLEMNACFNGGAGSELDALIDSLEDTDNYLPVNIGQLKCLAKPFYDRLIEKGLVQNYPWPETTGENYAPANVGQLKHLFSFGIVPESDSDSDGLPDTVEQTIGTNPGQADSDGDSLSDYWEAMRGWNATTLSATDPDATWTLDSQSFHITDQICAEELWYWTWQDGATWTPNNWTPNAEEPARFDITLASLDEQSSLQSTAIDGQPQRVFLDADGKTIIVKTRDGQSLFRYNPNDSTDAHSGEGCVSVTFENDSDWTVLGLATRSYHIDFRAFSHLVFWMKYDGPAYKLADFRFYVKFAEGGYKKEIHNLSQYYTFEQGAWFPVRIPLTDIVPNGEGYSLTDIMFVSPQNSPLLGNKIKIDDIALTTPLPAVNTANLYVDKRILGPEIKKRNIGINTATWDPNLLTTESLAALADLDFGIARFPGGNTSDKWNWDTTEEYINGNKYHEHASTLDEYLNMADSLGMEKNFTVNYLSATANDAYNCAAYIQAQGHSIDWWCIGNELYGDWQYGLNHDKVRITEPNPDEYATRFVAYDQSIKRVFGDAKVGICGTAHPFDYTNIEYRAIIEPDTGYLYHGWSANLLDKLAQLKVTPDFYEIHYYPQDTFREHDDLLLSASKKLALEIEETRRMLGTFLPSGESIPIQITEFNSVNADPGKQTVSLINAIYLTATWAQSILSGADSIMPWALHDKMEIGNNNAPYLDGNIGIYDGESSYFGSFALMSSHDLGSNNWEGIRRDIPFPAYYVWQMVRDFSLVGGNMILAHSDHELLRVHACKKESDINLLLINQSFSRTISIPAFEMNRWSPNENLDISMKIYDYNQYVNVRPPLSFSWDKTWDESWQDLQTVLSSGIPPLSMYVVTLHPKNND